ncbi:MAG: adenylate kinase family protein [Candidatus Lutacidiplasmatales archaeon]
MRGAQRRPGVSPGRAPDPEWALRVALTGTPGTGKSSVADALPRRIRREEVAEAALRLGAGHRNGRAVHVDLDALAKRLKREGGLGGPQVLVGHLAHLLPVRHVVLLRCDPRVVERRLARARRGTRVSRRENASAEATDAILFEALERAQVVYEIDTTRRSPGSVAREVTRWMEGAREPRFGTVDWLSVPAVTAQLLAPIR